MHMLTLRPAQVMATESITAQRMLMAGVVLRAHQNPVPIPPDDPPGRPPEIEPDKPMPVPPDQPMPPPHVPPTPEPPPVDDPRPDLPDHIIT